MYLVDHSICSRGANAGVRVNMWKEYRVLETVCGRAIEGVHKHKYSIGLSVASGRTAAGQGFAADQRT